MGGAGDIYNSISMPNYCDGPYIHVGVYTNKDPSAWTEVLVSPWPSRASIMPPGGRSWAIFDFLDRVASKTMTQTGEVVDHTTRSTPARTHRHNFILCSASDFSDIYIQIYIIICFRQLFKHHGLQAKLDRSQTQQTSDGNSFGQTTQ